VLLLVNFRFSFSNFKKIHLVSQKKDMETLRHGRGRGGVEAYTEAAKVRQYLEWLLLRTLPTGDCWQCHMALSLSIPPQL